MISLIMPAKNAEKYISEAIEPILGVKEYKWELLNIDDHSEDDTFLIAKRYEKIDSRVKVLKNTGIGKVAGLNYGYSLSKGDIIKCIDSDDVLVQDYFRYAEKLRRYDAHCHSTYVVDEWLNRISTYNMSASFKEGNYEFVLKNLISIPRCMWTFKREIAEKIFPMPLSLPFEDVWFSLNIKKYSNKIAYIDRPLYLYRQHGNQTFGGILNYSKDIVTFRARRMLSLIRAIEKDGQYLLNGINKPFDRIEEYYTLLSNPCGILEIISAKQRLLTKLKLLLIKVFPKIATFLTVLKWKLDKVRNSLIFND